MKAALGQAPGEDSPKPSPYNMAFELGDISMGMPPTEEGVMSGLWRDKWQDNSTTRGMSRPHKGIAVGGSLVAQPNLHADTLPCLLPMLS